MLGTFVPATSDIRTGVKRFYPLECELCSLFRPVSRSGIAESILGGFPAQNSSKPILMCENELVFQMHTFDSVVQRKHGVNQ